MSAPFSKYYEDHEAAYARIRERGFFGWGDVKSLDELLAFKESAEVDEALAVGRVPDGGRCLDLGCGSGPFSFYLARKGFRTVGIDVSESAIGLAREIANKVDLPCEFVLGDFLSVSLDGPFDFIVDGHFLHCIVFDMDRRRVLERVRSLLSPGGTFMLNTMIWDRPRDWKGPFEFDSNHVLWLVSDSQRTSDSVRGPDGRWRTPQRRVLPTALQLAELEQAGFAVESRRHLWDGTSLLAVCRARN